MANYIGVRCPVCNKKFDQPDDIVVCPICGAPHHRECYADKGECAFVGDHISGNVWRDPHEKDQTPGDGESGTCSGCGAGLPVGALFCHICGQNVNEKRDTASSSNNNSVSPKVNLSGWDIPGMEYINNPLYTVYGGVDPDEQVDGESVRDIAAYVGSSSAYYVPRFKEMSEKGRTISPNFAALFFNFFYYFYRKMYMLGAILFALYVVCSIPGYIYAKEIMPIAVSQMGFAQIFEQAGIPIPPADSVDTDRALHYQNLSYLARIINFAIGIIFSLCCNRFYYEKSVKDVRRIRLGVGSDEKDPSRGYRSALMHLGGVNKIAPAVAGVAYIVVYFIAVGIIYT